MFLLADKGLRWTLRWQTGLLESYGGTEQRVKLATLPRASFAGSIYLEDADLAAHRALLATDPDVAFTLPLPFEAVASVNAITSTTITISATYVDWNTAGRTIYVRGPAGDAYTTTIDSVGGGGATLTVLDSPPSGSFPAGSTMVMPCESVQLEEGQGFARWKAAAGRWDLAGRQVTARALGTTGAPAMTTLGSLDVLDRRPVVDGMAAEQILAGVTFQDAGGAFASSAAWSQAKPRRTFTWLVKGSSERQWWKQFLAARYGRLVTFRAPTWRPDLSLISYTAGTATMTIDATYANYLTRWWPSLAHRAIQIEMADGSFQRRTVTNAVDSGGGVTTLTVNSNLTGSPANVVQVCLLETARLDVDEVSIEWGPSMTGRVTLAYAVVQG